MALLHDTGKLVYGGLQLNLPLDLVPPLQWSRATNGVALVEGIMETRQGMTRLATVEASSPIHTLFRLTQTIPSVTGERLVGVGTSLYTLPLPNGTVPTALTGLSFDGGPLSIISFRFSDDPVSWAIIANANGMRKRRDGYYQDLGLPAPLTAAVVTAAGVGNLDSTGGTGYDWRYTYVNEVTNTESNGAPASGGVGSATEETRRPTASTNPDPTYGGTGYTTPNNAFDNNSATAATAAGTAGAGDSFSVQWNTWSAATGAYDALSIFIDSEVLIPLAPSSTVRALVDYSLNGGTTWVNLYSTTSARTRRTDEISIPPGTDLSLVRVRARTTTSVDALGVGTITHNVYEVYTIGDLTDTATTGLALVNQRARVCVVAPTDTQETAIRLYRRGGSLTAGWYFQGHYPVSSLAQGGCAAGTLEIIDDRADTDLASARLLELDNDMPVSSVEVMNQPLPAIWGPYDERVLGCGDPNRPESVYFSKRGNADAWPPQNHIEVSAPGEQMMNGVIWDTRCYAFSTEEMFVLVPNIIGGVTFAPFKTGCKRGLRSRWGLCLGSKGIYFVAKDGIYRTVGGPEESVIDDAIRPLFPTKDDPDGQSVNGYEAVDMSQTDDLRLWWHNGEVHFRYVGLDTAARFELAYDEVLGRWRPVDYNTDVLVGYSEPSTQSSMLLGGADGVLRLAGGLDDDGNDIAVTLRTGAFDQGVPLNLKRYSGVVVDLDPGGATAGSPVVITPYINGEASALAAVNVTGSGRQRVFVSVGETEAYNLELEFTWNANANIRPVLYQRDILYEVLPTSLPRWNAEGITHGIPGWQHVFDLWVCLEATADVTLTWTPDNGPVQTFTITATGSSILKRYVQFAANKFKVCNYLFTSASPFTLYAAESAARVKPWSSVGSFMQVSFGGDTAATR